MAQGFFIFNAETNSDTTSHWDYWGNRLYWEATYGWFIAEGHAVSVLTRSPEKLALQDNIAVYSTDLASQNKRF